MCFLKDFFVGNPVNNQPGKISFPIWLFEEHRPKRLLSPKIKGPRLVVSCALENLGVEWGGAEEPGLHYTETCQVRGWDSPEYLSFTHPCVIPDTPFPKCMARTDHMSESWKGKELRKRGEAAWWGNSLSVPQVGERRYQPSSWE